MVKAGSSCLCFRNRGRDSYTPAVVQPLMQPQSTFSSVNRVFFVVEPTGYLGLGTVLGIFEQLHN